LLFSRFFAFFGRFFAVFQPLPFITANNNTKNSNPTAPPVIAPVSSGILSIKSVIAVNTLPFSAGAEGVMTDSESGSGVVSGSSSSGSGVGDVSLRSTMRMQQRSCALNENVAENPRRRADLMVEDEIRRSERERRLAARMDPYAFSEVYRP
jgi:hypothetical protein